MGLRVQVEEFPQRFANHIERHKEFAESIATAVWEILKDYDEFHNVYVYNMGMIRRECDLGQENRFNILIGCSPKEDAGVYTEEIYINVPGGKLEYDVDVFELAVIEDRYERIMDDLGTTIAVLDYEQNVLYILYDVAKDVDDPTKVKWHIRYILDTLVKTTEITKKPKSNSWVNTDDASHLKEKLRQIATKQLEEELRQSKLKVATAEEDIKYFRNKLEQEYRILEKMKRELAIRQSISDNANENKLIEQMNLIANHPRVKDIIIEDDRFIINVPDIHVYDVQGREYYIGDFTISIRYDSSTIYFKNTNNRRTGYWSSRDHHPHISGEGQACFGNLEFTVAELSAQAEYYALYLSLLDFLENVNELDVAGGYVSSWDIVDGEEDESHLEEYEEEPEY